MFKRGETQRLEDEVRQKADQMLGTKHCFKCNRHRKLEGGTKIKSANGTVRWVCETCAQFYKKRKAA